MRVLVIGGTLFIGKLLVKRLLAADHEVTILHRKAEHPFGRRVRNIIADRNDVVHGRILQLEQHMFPFPRWVLAIRFDTLEHDGVEQPLLLKSRDRRGTFIFEQAGHILIDQSFQSESETR